MIKHVKNDGTILLPTLIISGMLLGLALTLTKIVSSELQFAADLLLAERAYFAAESGVEQSLLSLRDDPINWVKITTSLPHSSSVDVNVANSKQSFEFSLNAKTSTRWQLGIDADDEVPVNATLVKNFEITGPNILNNLQWKLQCDNNGIKMLQARANANPVQGSSMGTYDNGVSVSQQSINTFLSSFPDNTRCYISLTNFGIVKIDGTISTNDLMAPAQTYVRAEGKAGGREKIIEFEYRKKNLNPFFDFGLLHKN